jgi:drug/metabolite transporter (DMT)-like permease
VAVVLSLLCSLVWGAADFSGGLISRRLPAIVIVGWSACFGLVFMTVTVSLQGGWHGPWGWAPWGVAAGVASASGVLSYYSALASGTMGVVAPVASLGVVVPVIFGLVTGETPSTMVAGGIVVAIVGVVCASGPEFVGKQSARPVLVAALAGFCFGIFFVFLANGSESSALLTVWTMRATVTLGFVVLAIVRRTTGNLERRDSAWVLGIAAGDLAANVLLGIATTLGYVSITSVLSSLYPVVTVVIAAVVLRERLLRVQVVGVVVTMLGVALISSG